MRLRPPYISLSLGCSRPPLFSDIVLDFADLSRFSIFCSLWILLIFLVRDKAHKTISERLGAIDIVILIDSRFVAEGSRILVRGGLVVRKFIGQKKMKLTQSTRSDLDGAFPVYQLCLLGTPTTSSMLPLLTAEQRFVV